MQAITGTYVTLLGFDVKPADCDHLMGFAIHRTDHTENTAYWLDGMKCFKATDPGFAPGAKYSTREQPIQGFAWGDYSAKPGHDYTYRVLALTGTPANLQPATETSVRIQTESPVGQTQHVFFNRGAAASQEYARRFGNRKPDDVGPPALRWLSRGLYEAMLAFIARATGPGFELRVCAYEFHYPGVLDALRDAKKRGVKLHVIYDHRGADPATKNDAAVKKAGIPAALCVKRKKNPSAISHNKFIVLLEHGAAKAVLTGGTNFSEGGIFGHSNAVHIVDDPAVAAAYVKYWDLLSTDPEFAHDHLKTKVDALATLPHDAPADGTMEVFSPRSQTDALSWYATLAAGAQKGLFATFAFGINPVLQDVYRTSTALIRYALLDKATRPMKDGPEKTTEEKRIRRLRAMPENRFAIGAYLKMNMFDHWRAEKLTGLNKNVAYVHTKYMLVDPLGPDPIVVAGSANFSAASSDTNDENMLVIRGNTRVAHIYVTEFMRLYNHYAFREWASKQPAHATAHPEFLKTDNTWWKEYFGNSDRARQREYFAT